MSLREAWAGIDVDPQRTLVYGPRFGRLYLLATADARDAGFGRVVGLAAAARFSTLADPVDRIEHDLNSLNGERVASLPLLLPVIYRVLQASRYVVPLRVAIMMVRIVAALFGRYCIPAGASSSEIGRLVHALDQRVGTADCYPRSLMTAFLCLSAERYCTVVVGVLAPTRKMHAWCSVDRCLPYEPSPEHYLYQPVWTVTVSP